MQINYGTLDGHAADIRTASASIEGRLDQLTRDLAPLRSDWTGAASDSYQVAKAKWDAGMNDIRALLLDIGTGVSTSNAEYQSTENTNTARWS